MYCKWFWEHKRYIYTKSIIDLKILIGVSSSWNHLLRWKFSRHISRQKSLCSKEILKEAWIETSHYGRHANRWMEKAKFQTSDTHTHDCSPRLPWKPITDLTPLVFVHCDGTHARAVICRRAATEHNHWNLSQLPGNTHSKAPGSRTYNITCIASMFELKCMIEYVITVRLLQDCCLFFFGGGGAQQPPMGQGLLIHVVSKSHSTTHHSR